MHLTACFQLALNRPSAWLRKAVHNMGSGARCLGSNPASSTSCLGQPQACYSLPQNKGSNDHSSHIVGWEAMWVNLYNGLAQIPKCVVKVKDADGGDNGDDNNDGDDDSHDVHWALCTCGCHASVMCTGSVILPGPLLSPSVDGNRRGLGKLGTWRWSEIRPARWTEASCDKFGGVKMDRTWSLQV